MGCIIKYKKQSIPEEQFLQYLNKQIAINNLFETNGDFASKIYEALGFKQSNLEAAARVKKAEEDVKQIHKIGIDTEYEDVVKSQDKNRFHFLDTNDFKNTNQKSVNIEHVHVPEKYRNKGYGLSLYIVRGEELLKEGKSLISYDQHSPEAEIVWQRLLQLGLATQSGEYGTYQYVGLKGQITSQQKQQAQQLYSQYLDTVFPDSKVKDIVYHGTNKKFDKFDKNFLSKYDVGYYGKGFYFSTKPNKSYSDKNYHKQELDGVMLSVLVNLPNPNYKASNDFSDTGKDVVKDKGVIVIDEDLDNELTEKTKTPEEFVNALLKLGKYDIDQIVVFEPEQIHILGTEQDIEGFRQWMQSQGGKDTTVLDNLISKLEQFGIIEKDCSGRSIKAKDGIRSKFTKGSQWELVKDLKGYPSHAQGGVDIKLGKDGFSFTRNGGQILAAYGLVLPNASEP